MSDHSFNPIIAKKYSVDVAIFINNMIFWTRQNYANNNNFREGYYWTYNTHESLTKYFPYWNARQIKYLIKKAIDHRLIKKGNFNIKGFDKTAWYRLTDDALLELNLDKTCLNPNPGLIRQNCPIDETKLSHPSDKIVPPIPDTNHIQTTTIKTFVDLSSTESYRDDELFMKFYSNYPHKQKPEAARKAFYKHRPTEEFVLMLNQDVSSRTTNNWKNRPKDKIPFPATYLNSKEWEGEIYHSEINVNESTKKAKRYSMDELMGGIL